MTSYNVPYDIVMLVELRCAGTHACWFAVSTKGNRFLTLYLPPWMTRPLICRFFKGKQRLFYKPSDNLQLRNGVISMLQHKYEASWRRTDIVLTSYNVPRTDVVLTSYNVPYDIVMLVELRCAGTHACSFAVSTKGNRFLTLYLPPWMTRPFKKKSTLKGKYPRWVLIFFFKNWLPLKRVVKTKMEVASL